MYTMFSLSLMNGSNKFVSYYTRLDKLIRDQHFSLLGLFVIYEEN
jgi:hypothetical protein